MNTPNKLTVFRILLIPVLIVFILVQQKQNRLLYATIVFIIAALTDHLDGKLARKNGQITDFGKFLDPLADKMLVMSSFICFVDIEILSAVPVIIILMREFIVTSIRLVAMSSGKVIAANFWGKLKTVSQIIAIIVILFLEHIKRACIPTMLNFSARENVLMVFETIDLIFIWVSVLFTLVSGIIYIMDNIEIIKTAK